MPIPRHIDYIVPQGEETTLLGGSSPPLRIGQSSAFRKVMDSKQLAMRQSYEAPDPHLDSCKVNPKNFSRKMMLSNNGESVPIDAGDSKLSRANFE